MENVYLLLLAELVALVIGVPLFFLLRLHKDITTHNGKENANKENKNMSINKSINVGWLRKHIH